MKNIDMCLNIPNTNKCLHPGDKVKLGRFENAVWAVNYGWFEFDGNRAICCWYLSSENNMISKPLNIADLDDIYMITR